MPGKRFVHDLNDPSYYQWGEADNNVSSKNGGQDLLDKRK